MTMYVSLQNCRFSVVFVLCYKCNLLTGYYTSSLNCDIALYKNRGPLLNCFSSGGAADLNGFYLQSYSNLFAT